LLVVRQDRLPRNAGAGRFVNGSRLRTGADGFSPQFPSIGSLVANFSAGKF